jgi:hypothetical protein
MRSVTVKTAAIPLPYYRFDTAMGRSVGNEGVCAPR